MRVNLLLAAMFMIQYVFAQRMPSEVGTPAMFSMLELDVPGIRKDVTIVKFRLPNQPHAAWFDLNVPRIGSKLIAGMNFTEYADPKKSPLLRAGCYGNEKKYEAEVFALWYDDGWQLSSRQYSSFDTAGNPLQWDVWNWSYVSHMYMAKNRYVYFYDSVGNFTGYTRNDMQGNDYGASRVLRYVNGQRVSDTTYTYTPREGTKVYSSHQEYFYNGTQLDSIVTMISKGSGFAFKHALRIIRGADGGVDQVKTYVYNSTQGKIILESLADFISNPSGVGVEEHDGVQYTVYPVPASNQVFITIKDPGEHTVIISDLQGRKVFTGTVVQETKLDVSMFENGIYILSVTNNMGATSNKRIVMGK